MITQQKWGKIRQYCENILDCISFLPELSGLEQRQLEKDKQTIGRIIRRVTIATELEGRRVVCVAGLQGSGKTSMLRRLLDLDEQLLPSTSGRGERLPILIFRGSVPAPAASRTFLQEDLESGNWRMVEETLENADDLKEFAVNGGDGISKRMQQEKSLEPAPVSRTFLVYLLQHAENPVDWRAGGRTHLKRRRRSQAAGYGAR